MRDLLGSPALAATLYRGPGSLVGVPNSLDTGYSACIRHNTSDSIRQYRNHHAQQTSGEMLGSRDERHGEYGDGAVMTLLRVQGSVRVALGDRGSH